MKVYSNERGTDRELVFMSMAKEDICGNYEKFDVISRCQRLTCDYMWREAVNTDIEYEPDDGISP